MPVVLLALGAFGLILPSLLAGQAPQVPQALPVPELTGDSWLNLPAGTKLTLASRKGKVTIVHFWTYGCINCRRNLSYYAAWQRRYGSWQEVMPGKIVD